ncbi:MAG: CBS domain-containing protein [Casimicrobiaceae bacterium]
MADPDVLTHAFLASHPADAARVLEAMGAEDAMALFERVPVRLAAPVLEVMRPYTAARALPVDVARGAMLLSGLSVPAAATLLRYLPESRRAALIDGLPTGMALACRALLGYPEDSVGACVDPDVVALLGESRVREALDALRETRVKRTGAVYVVDRDRRPLGQVELPALLQAAPETRLKTLARGLPGTLPAVTPIGAAQEHPVWQRADVVPVVERGGALVGVIARSALNQDHDRSADAGSVDSFGALVATGYWHAVSALIEAALSALGAPAKAQR